MKFKGKWTLPGTPFKRYENILNKSLDDPEIFSKFKSMEGYNQIVGCDRGGVKSAKNLAKIIKVEYPFLLDKRKEMKENDRIGNPPIFYTMIGKFSPNTLFYMYVVGELNKHFGSLDGLNIIEIGSAYGGQCFVLSQYYKFKSYTLIDTPASIELSKRYLSKFLIKNIIFQDTRNIKSKYSDLFISTFAFNEMNNEGWDFYIDNIISKTNKFYIMMFMNGAKYDELYNKLKEHFDIKTYEVPPHGRKTNGLWVGTHK